MDRDEDQWLRILNKPPRQKPPASGKQKRVLNPQYGKRLDPVTGLLILDRLNEMTCFQVKLGGTA